MYAWPHVVFSDVLFQPSGAGTRRNKARITTTTQVQQLPVAADGMSCASHADRSILDDSSVNRDRFNDVIPPPRRNSFPAYTPPLVHPAGHSSSRWAQVDGIASTIDEVFRRALFGSSVYGSAEIFDQPRVDRGRIDGEFPGESCE